MKLFVVEGEREEFRGSESWSHLNPIVSSMFDTVLIFLVEITLEVISGTCS